MEVRLDFKVRDARETLKILQRIPGGEDQRFQRQLRDALTSALAKHDAEAKVRKREKEQREKFEKEQQEAEAQCAKQGHMEPIYQGNGVRLLDCQTIPGTALTIPMCPRCRESLVQLKDGTWMNWLKWTETKPLMELTPEFLPAPDKQHGGETHDTLEDKDSDLER